MRDLAKRLREPFNLAVVVLAVVGLFVRYHGLSRQIVLDDEWHSLAYAADRDIWELATHYFPNATSIPVNIYHRAVLMAWGWSELSVRLLSVVATAATLVAWPFIVRRSFGSPVLGVVAGLLLALCPFWVFYGQSARPYATFLLFLLLANHFLARALREEDRRSWAWFALTAAAAVWFHLFALPALAVLVLPVAVRIGKVLRAEGWSSPRSRRLLIDAFLGFGGWTLLVLASYGPALLNGIGRQLPSGDHSRTFDLTFLRHSAELLSGVRFTGLAALECALAVVGLVLLARKKSVLLSCLLLGTLGSLAFTLFIQPEQYYVAVVTWRYNVGAFPLFWLGFAGLLVHSWEAARRAVPRLAHPAASGGSLVGLGIAVALTTPLWRDWSTRPNNFRLHSAYQESYGEYDPSRAYESAFFGRTIHRSVEDLPEIYRQLARAPHPCHILEYPIQKPDHVNPLQFYQTQHGCEVTAGYSLKDGTGDRLNARRNAARLRFERLIPVEDADQIKRTGIELIVVHLDGRHEIHERHAKSKPDISKETRRVLRSLERQYGEPTYKDAWLRAFSVRRASRE